jgi:hypothetical protein
LRMVVLAVELAEALAARPIMPAAAIASMDSLERCPAKKPGDLVLIVFSFGDKWLCACSVPGNLRGDPLSGMSVGGLALLLLSMVFSFTVCGIYGLLDFDLEAD